MRIVSIGDMVTDYYYKDGKLLGVNGGMTSHNVIANLQKRGHKTKVIGVCGTDSAGEVATKSLSDIGVDITDIQKTTDDTRCFHVSYIEEDRKLKFISKKRCPICNNKKWYEESLVNVSKCAEVINEDDIIVIDNLNSINIEIIQQLKNDIMLDLGQYFEFENKSDDELLKILKKKFCIIQLNERVEVYLKNRFAIKNTVDIFNLLNAKLVVVTRGENGVDFIYDNKIITKKPLKVIEEVDASGAGDAFFASVIASYIESNRNIDGLTIHRAFENSVDLTKRVIEKIGARGHLNSLYKINNLKDVCTCEDFEMKKRKKIKRINININSLEKRILNSLNNDLCEKLEDMIKGINGTTLYLGTGGSFAAAYFASKVVNELTGTTTVADYPREVHYRNNKDVDKIFLFSYSGTTPDLLTVCKELPEKDIMIVTKGVISKLMEKTEISKQNIISYNNGLCKGKERGFLSFEGVMAPSTIFLSLILKERTSEFVKQQIQYWNEYFKEYFKDNKENLSKILEKDNVLTLFKGDYTNTSALDLESKIIESGLYNLNIHEKKNFSHGRFINLEHQRNDCYIYLKQRTTTEYEEKLLTYLDKGKTILIESQFMGLEAEYDLLIASQYFMFYVSQLLDIDISKPAYSEESMKIYFYKGDL